MPSLMYRLGTICFVSPWIFLFLYADHHKIWQTVSSTLNYSIALLISQSWPKSDFSPCSSGTAMISTGLHRGTVRFWRQHPCSEMEQSHLSQAHYWAQRSGANLEEPQPVPSACHRAWQQPEQGDFRYHVSSSVISGPVFYAVTTQPS